MKLPDQLRHWTADEVAECLSLSKGLYSRLWTILSKSKNPTPLGGDGSNGTVETPDGRLDPENDDKAPHWWGDLTLQDQQEITDAVQGCD